MPNNALIIAKDKNDIIAINGKLPWRCPADMNHFKEVSMQFDYIIMGKNTYFSLQAPLTNRKCIVLSSQADKFVSDNNFQFMYQWQVEELLKSKAYCLVIGGADTALRLLDYIDSVFLSIIKTPLTYNLKNLKNSKVTYFDHDFKYGQYVDEKYHGRKNKFDLDTIVEYDTFRLEVWERKGPYFEKVLKLDDYDLTDPNVKERKCLHCSTKFLSSWSGNRICDICKCGWEYKANQELGEEHYFPESIK